MSEQNNELYTLYTKLESLLNRIETWGGSEYKLMNKIHPQIASLSQRWGEEFPSLFEAAVAYADDLEQTSLSLEEAVEELCERMGACTMREWAKRWQAETDAEHMKESMTAFEERLDTERRVIEARNLEIGRLRRKVDTMEWVAELNWLAAQLPTGLRDPKALEKLGAEQAEMAQSALSGDQIGALLEAADCAYYAAKAVANRLASYEDAAGILADMANHGKFHQSTVLAAARRKYQMRAKGQKKDDKAERAAVEHMI